MSCCEKRFVPFQVALSLVSYLIEVGAISRLFSIEDGCCCCWSGAFTQVTTTNHQSFLSQSRAATNVASFYRLFFILESYQSPYWRHTQKKNCRNKLEGMEWAGWKGEKVHFNNDRFTYFVTCFFFFVSFFNDRVWRSLTPLSRCCV